jgi:hypothetical protein
MPAPHRRHVDRCNASEKAIARARDGFDKDFGWNKHAAPPV